MAADSGMELYRPQITSLSPGVSVELYATLMRELGSISRALSELQKNSVKQISFRPIGRRDFTERPADGTLVYTNEGKPSTGRTPDRGPGLYYFNGIDWIHLAPSDPFTT